MRVFGERVCAGHHGRCPLLQLAQFLSSLIQSYSRTRQFSHHARCRPLHALHTARSWDVLRQTARGLASCRLANCADKQ